MSLKNQVKKLFLLLLLAVTFVTSVTYAPPPQVNISVVLTLNQSAVGSRFIGSKRVEGLQLSQTGNTTTFSMAFFNRSANNSMNQYSLSAPGTWIYLGGTQQTLSCNLVYELSTQTFGMLQFQNDIGSFQMFANISLTRLQSLISAPNNSSNYTTIASNFILGENCYVGKLFDNIYRISGVDQTLNIIRLPSGWTIQAVTESYQYGISANSLYRFNQDLNQYDLIYSFSNFNKYFLYEYNGRMIISASNEIVNASMNNFNIHHIKQSIFYFNDVPSGLKLLGRVDIEGYSYNINYIEIFTSPQLTKMGLGYNPIGSNSSTPTILAKSIDYLNSQVVDLTFNDLPHYLQTIQGTNSTQFDFSDYFLVVRNISGVDSNSSLKAYQEAYQFIGNQIVFFNSRPLNSSWEFVNWTRIAVDLYFSSTLVALDIYRTSNGYEVNQVEYGNYAATKKVIPTEKPAFIQFPNPTFTSKESQASAFTWAFYNFDGTVTTLTIKWFSPQQDGNIQSVSKNITGSISTVASSKPYGYNCRILRESNSNSYFILSYYSSNNSMILSDSLTATLSGVNITAATVWTISSNCDRFSVGGKVFRKVNSTYQAINNTFAMDFADQTLTYVTVGSAIWKYDSSQTRYVFYTNLTTLYPITSIKSYQNRVIVVASNSSSAVTNFGVQGFAMLDENGALTSFSSYSSTFKSAPLVKTSMKLSKVFISGSRGSGTYSVDTFHIDFSQKQATNITFPTQSIKDFAYTFIDIFEQQIYVRQSVNPASSDDPNSANQFVYYLSQNILPQLLLKRNITAAQALADQKQLIIQKEQKSYLAIQSYYPSANNSNVVNAVQLNLQQAALNSNPNKAVNGFFSGGVITLCSPGCSDCSTLVCTGCVSGYAFNTNTALCQACAPGCTACNSANPLNCSQCYSGTYLSGSSCLPCSASCISCSGSADSCLSCLPGQYFNSGAGQCMLCSRNCLVCTSDSTCTQCRKGFVVTPAGTCRGCSLSCSSCTASNITQCTACAEGLQLVGSQCIQCPSNCLTCNSGLCQKCSPGYSINSAGVCVLNCRLPCATCVDNQPTTCLSCYSSATLSGSTCVVNTSCNDTSTCTDCGQGLGYFLFASKCFPCSSITQIPNCLQCSQANQQICSICADGYYLNSTGLCPACPASCTTCVSSVLCTSCASAFTLPSGQTQAQCIACKVPCATCSGDSTYCKTCVTGYTKRGWKCQNNTFIGFSFTLSGSGVDASQVLSNIDNLVTALLTLMGENSTNVDAITISNVISGSVTVSGSATPTTSTSTALSGISSGVSGGSIAGYSITSSSVSTVDLNGSESSSNTSNNALIIGLTVGLVIFVVILIVIIVCVFKIKRAKNDEARINDISVNIPSKNGSILYPAHVEPSNEIFKVQVVSLQEDEVWEKALN